jgi:acyl carrier protein
MTEAEAYAGLNELFRDLFADETIELRPETVGHDIEGWDSYTNLNVIVATETRFGIKLRTNEIEGLKNVGDLVSIIVARAPTMQK